MNALPTEELRGACRMPASAGPFTNGLSIGVTALNPRSGCTHCALTMALEITRTHPDWRVACVLCDPALLARIFTEVVMPKRRGVRIPESFEFKGVTLCRFGAPFGRDDYDVIVYDCGLRRAGITDASSAGTMFSISDVKAVTYTGQVWDLPIIRDAMASTSAAEVRTWRWVSWLASSELTGKLGKLLTSVLHSRTVITAAPLNANILDSWTRDGLDSSNLHASVLNQKDDAKALLKKAKKHAALRTMPLEPTDGETQTKEESE